MTGTLLAVLLSVPARAQAPSLQWIQSVGNSQSTQAFNSNFIALQNANRDNLVKTVSDVDCSAAGGGNGGALTGATEKGGFIYGGACTAILSSTGSVVFSSGVGTNYANAISSVAVTVNVAITQTLASGATPGWVAVGNSTITYVTPGSYVQACYTGTLENETANGSCTWTVIIDGSIPSVYDTNHDIAQSVSTTGGYPQNASACVQFKVTANVSHTYAMVVHSATAGGTTCYVGAHTNNVGQITPYFQISTGL